MARSGRHFLQIPGPTNVPNRVLRAMDTPTIGHCGLDFAALGKRVLDGLEWTFTPVLDFVLGPVCLDSRLSS